MTCHTCGKSYHEDDMVWASYQRHAYCQECWVDLPEAVQVAFRTPPAPRTTARTIPKEILELFEPESPQQK